MIRKIDNVVQRKGVCWLSLRNDARAKTSCSKEWRSVFFDEGGRKRGEGEKRSGRRAWPSGIPGFAKSARRGWFSVSTGRITGACLSLPDKPAAKRRRWLNRSRGCDLSSPLDQPDVWKRERERERDAGSCADNPFSSPSFFPYNLSSPQGKKFWIAAPRRIHRWLSNNRYERMGFFIMVWRSLVKLIAKNLWKKGKGFSEKRSCHTRRGFFVTRVIDVIPWEREERERGRSRPDRGNDKRKGGKKGGGFNAGCWGKGKISAWVSRERLRDRGDGRLNIGFSDARGTYLMSYIFRWPAQFKFPFTENSPGGRGKGEGGKLRYLALNY